jgi:hypothetical protein
LFAVFRIATRTVERATNSDAWWLTADHDVAARRAEIVGGVVCWAPTRNALLPRLAAGELVIGRRPGTYDAIITLPPRR